MVLSLQHGLLFSALLFAIGAAGVVVRRNIVVVLLSVEMMLLAAGAALLAFARWTLLPEGQWIALFALVVMGAEAAVGLALAVACFRLRGTLLANEMRQLRE